MEENKPKGFWDSLTGFIVKLTAFIVAVTGLYALYVNRQTSATPGQTEIAHVNCVTNIYASDSPKEIQDKFSCLVEENKALRKKTPVKTIYPIIYKMFVAHNPQELLQIKSNLLSWVTSHNGTIVNGTGVDKPTIAGYAGTISVLVGCLDQVGVCVVTGTGPNGQDVNDAVAAIHSG